MANSHRWLRHTGAVLLAGGTLFTGELIGSASVQAAPLLAQSPLPGRSRPLISPEERRRLDLEFQLREARRRSAEQTVRWDLARFLNIRPWDVRIVQMTYETWPDSCLGLAEPGEGCTVAIVNGWEIVAEAGNRTWLYRANLVGQVRQEGEYEEINQLRQQAIDRVLQRVVLQFDVPIEQLHISEVEMRDWDGCLGVSEPDEPCALIGITGWRIVATDGRQHWVYHTDLDGTGAVFNPRASQSQSKPNLPERSTRAWSRFQQRLFR
jgi:hypothetical protein